jgi:PTH1 family peptidyl-tRNA hydrolase
MWLPFWKKRKKATAITPDQWILVLLGNPGSDYACTRHNLGRLMVQRWLDNSPLAPVAVQNFYYGTLYSMTDGLLALVPSTYMNLSGKAVAEAVKSGIPKERLVVVYDDKDLPLGMGRLSINGGAAGHKGLQSIIDELGTDDVLRLRFGIGPFRRPLHEWVLDEWLPEEWGIIEKMDAPFAKFLSKLAEGPEIANLQGSVNAAAFWGYTLPAKKET